MSRPLAAFLFAFATVTAGGLPAALMMDGQPVHPQCVVATQFGDSSRFEPVEIVCTVDCSGRYDYIAWENAELDYSQLDVGVVGSSRDFRFDGIEGAFHQEERYQAWPLADNLVLVLAHHYSTDGTGRWSNLGIVRREGAYLINAGEIACGDRAWGRITHVERLSDEVFECHSLTTPADMVQLVCETCDILGITTEQPLRASPADRCGELILRLSICEGVANELELVGIDHFSGS